MKNSFEFPMSEPKAPVTPAPVFDEQIKSGERFNLHDEEFWEKMNELLEDDPGKYNELMALVVEQLEEDQKNNKTRVSKEDRKKQKEEERLKAIERYKNSLDELYNKDGTEKYTDI